MSITGRARTVVAWTALPLALLIVWWFATAGSANPFVPPLPTILAKFPDVWTADRLVFDVAPSVARLFVGLCLALVLGTVLGVALGTSRNLRAFLGPVLEFVRALPPPVLVPVLILVTGIGSTMKVLVVLSGCLWPILLNTVAGVRGIDEVLDDTCRAYHVRGRARMWHLVVRSASPQILIGVRQALSVGIILMVISEMFAASNGIGFTVIQFQRSFALPEMWTGIIVLGLLGVVLGGAMRLVERRLLFWHSASRKTAGARR